MSQSHAKNYIHLIYSTKGRRRWISEALQKDLWAYQAGIFQNWESPALIIGGIEDHVHALFMLSKNYTLKKIVEEVKKSSSVWMKNQGQANFSWQGGYAAFSVSQSALPVVTRYVKDQKKHHEKMSYQDELRALLQKHAIEFNEDYLWT